MLDIVKRFFNKDMENDSKTEGQKAEHDARVATCALFLEMARIDNMFTESEMETILSVLHGKYGLSPEHAKALFKEADKELVRSVDLWRFAKLINDNYSVDEKIEVIEILWQIVFVDGKLDKYEDYLMRKLANLLRLSHNQLIDAKLRITHAE